MYIYTYTLQSTNKICMSDVVVIFVSDHKARIVNYNFLLLYHSILFLSSTNPLINLDSLPGRMTQNFITKRSESSVLQGFFCYCCCCYAFLLTLLLYEKIIKNPKELKNSFGHRHILSFPIMWQWSHFFLVIWKKKKKNHLSQWSSPLICSLAQRQIPIVQVLYHKVTCYFCSLDLISPMLSIQRTTLIFLGISL